MTLYRSHSKLWLSNDISHERVEKLSAAAGISPLMAKVFISREIEDTVLINRFLNPSLDELHDPFLMADMDKAVGRIIEALDNKEKIVVYGDYDVDGTTSTSILLNFLAGQGASVDFFIPDRMDDGYGLSINAIDKIFSMEPSLIITVDCGVTAVEEVDYIRAKKVDIIITDHHECKSMLPAAFAVVNPCRPDCGYPFKSLAGVGVVYKLITALCIKLGLGNIYNEYLDLVAIGTVADVVPLVDENRVIVRYGLLEIKSTSNIGLKTLIENSGLKDKPVNSWGISFVIAPRINVAGRIGDAGRVVRLFTTGNQDEASVMVLELNDENRLRQETEALILQQVLEEIEGREGFRNEKVIVAAGKGWHHGIIGIVASKVMEKYYKPCVLISCENGMGKGSARSVEGFSMFRALDYCRDLLVKFGGHELAAGLSLRQEQIEAFRRMINDYAETVINESDLVPKLRIDTFIDYKDINIDNVRELERLAPHGAGNPSPVFAYNNLRINDIRTVGEDRHLKMKLEDGNFLVDGIGFNMGGLAEEYKRSAALDAAFSLEINTWNSVERVQLNIRDIRPDGDTALEDGFYQTLDKCIEINTAVADPMEQNFATGVAWEPEDGLLGKLTGINNSGEKVVIFVSSLESTKRLVKILENSAFGIKIPYEICYTGFNGRNTGLPCVVINPDADVLDLSGVDEIVFYGNWIDRKYFYKLLDKTAWKKRSFFISGALNDPDYQAIIPKRQDVVAVYQHIKAKSGGEKLPVKDLNVLAKSIGYSYKISMNCFKLKKTIEVLEELGLITKESIDKDGMYIKVNISNGKTRLENSVLFRSLQRLAL